MTPSRSKAVFITGAAKRLGRAVVLHLADQGYNVALHYNTSKAEAMHTAQAIYKKGVHCELFACDLADEGAVLQLLPKVHKAFPGLSVLINSASIFIPDRFGDEDLTLFKAHWDINFKAPYVLSCAFSRLVKQGQIINFIDRNTTRHSTTWYQPTGRWAAASA
ncbi:MAG: SDR family NAD(P)-dependent oxidoreductase, partial [Candidatus Omnitrophica bacterium]|nr:SDR family NAD(P)-dependent oxidoreductase [Candidatus Omnitrophota bacterium]